MKICPLHDVAFPDGGTCWCCDRAAASASPDDQLKAANSLVEHAKQDLQAAENAVVSTTERVKQQLQAAVDKATAEAKDAAAKLAAVVGDAAGNAVTNSN